jgi:hypothetical protein
MATPTNIDISGVDFSEIFSSDTTNTTYTSKYPSLGNLATTSTSTLRGTTPVGFQVAGTDAVTIFSPIYKDVTDDGTTVVNIPIWASKVGFVVHGSGGTGGVAFTNYWRHIAIPTYNQRVAQASNRNAAPYQFVGQSYQNRDQYHFFYRTNAPFGSFHINFGSNYGRTYFHTYTTNYGRFYYANYNTNYSRDSVSQLSYYSSSGGGGSCCAGVYNIQSGDKATKMTISCNINGNYAVQFNDSKQTNSVSNNGGNVILSSSTGSAAAPIDYTVYSNVLNPGSSYTTSTTNSSTDTRGLGATAAHSDPGSYITSKYTSNGSDGVTTTGSTTIIGGNGGIDTGTTGTTIKSNFTPVIPSSNRGKGGNGSNTNVKNSGNSGMVRYWFIR